MQIATDTVADKIRLCSEALTLVNSSSITSFEEGTRSSAMASLHYERVYRACLTRSRWSFTRKYEIVAPIQDLALKHAYPRPSAAPTPGSDAGKLPVFPVLPNRIDLPYRYRYKRPADCINLYGVMAPNMVQDPISVLYNYSVPQEYGRLDAYITDFQQRGGEIYSNYKALLFDYQRRIPEDELYDFPLFRDYLVNSLAACFAQSVQNDDAKQEKYALISEDLYALAASTDTNSNPMDNVNYSTTIVRMRNY